MAAVSPYFKGSMTRTLHAKIVYAGLRVSFLGHMLLILEFISLTTHR